MFNLRAFGAKKVAQYGMARVGRTSMARFSTTAKEEATAQATPAADATATANVKDSFQRVLQTPKFTVYTRPRPSYEPEHMPSPKEMYFGGLGQTLKCESRLKRRTAQQFATSIGFGLFAGYLYTDMYRLRFKWYDLVQWESSEVVKDAHAYYESQGIPNNSAIN